MPAAHTYNPVTGDYVSTSEDHGYTPANATRVDLPPRPWGRQWPRWNGEVWEMVPDHRERKTPAYAAGDEQAATDYWLPGDTWETPARQMVAPGPLPEGALLTRPEKPAPTEAERFASLRAERDRRLALTDYALMPDYPATDAQREAVAIYRQALRDLPQQGGAPWDGGGEMTPWPAMPVAAGADAAVGTEAPGV